MPLRRTSTGRCTPAAQRVERIPSAGTGQYNAATTVIRSAPRLVARPGIQYHASDASAERPGPGTGPWRVRQYREDIAHHIEYFAVHDPAGYTATVFPDALDLMSPSALVQILAYLEDVPPMAPVRSALPLRAVARDPCGCGEDLSGRVAGKTGLIAAGGRWLRVWLALTMFTACGDARPPRLVLGTTHTLEDSGVLSVLTDAYIEEHGSSHRLSVVVAGSGEILAMAQLGDVDVVLSHAPDAELALVAAGGAESRLAVMHNDFVLLGPLSDPAGAAGAGPAVVAFRRIAAAEQPFVSRGDDSGTHRREQAVWAEAQLDPGWSAYIEAGTGMAEALRLASQRNAYILSDRATFEVLRTELQIGIVYENEDELVNEYSVLVTTGTGREAGARQLADWLAGARAQRLIGAYRAPGSDQPLFIPVTAR
jgi:tungstate transport system substrate-binding protein